MTCGASGNEKAPEIDMVSNRSGHRRGDQTHGQTNRIGVRMSDFKFLPQGADLIYSSHRGVAVIIASIIDRWTVTYGFSFYIDGVGVS